MMRCYGKTLIIMLPTTQPGHPSLGKRNEYQPKGDDAMRLQQVWFVSGWHVKLCDPVAMTDHLSALAMGSSESHNRALYKCSRLFLPLLILQLQNAMQQGHERQDDFQSKTDQ